MTNPVHLRRIRWLVRLTLMLGVAASVTANMLHAHHNPISQGIAAWPPLALLLSVELISRVPVHRRALALARLAATAVIAAIAAWVSYWHMAGVTARYGESPVSAHLMPICVDGLIVVASISLAELAGRLQSLDTQTGTAPSNTRARSAPPRAAPARPRQPGDHAGSAAAATAGARRTPPAKAAPRARKATPGRDTTVGTDRGGNAATRSGTAPAAARRSAGGNADIPTAAPTPAPATPLSSAAAIP